MVEFQDSTGVTVIGRTRTKRGPKPSVQSVVYDTSDESTSGQLQPIAARVLMKVLYAARVCRFDLLRAVCSLATKVTMWDSSCDTVAPDDGLHPVVSRQAARGHRR